ncbi:hypothetical protein GOP47_0013561 [Adiantum capillus-veneris]|uniref:DUF72 domain-containing protein n=1 Tax=Adiantum capillus-veneris TaxID=13818 RepID=A0A9D4UNS0_ADICA|nr:hypothetical protein GOP47_0013561 [Adiantum capillus-veneris]
MAELESSSTRARKVLMGTCGWSDQTLLKCGKFYPASVRSAEDRLRHYSTHFPCVEVDTSTYAIPSIASVKGWLRSVPKGFFFHFKAFGFFCSKSCSLTSLPVHMRGKVSATCPGKDHIHLNDLSVSIRDELWQSFNKVLHVARDAGNLGVVVFQFHLSFKPTKENQAHVEWCRENLDACFSMAAEFRCRDWVKDERLISTTKWLISCGITLVAADELQHETFQKDREQTGLPQGQSKVILPVAWALTNPDFMYVRVHRREGCQRLLSETELLCWATRLLAELPKELKGPIYFMWGTDWEDQPIVNAKGLNAKLADMAFDWKAVQQLTAPKSVLETYFLSLVSKSEEGTGVVSKHACGTERSNLRNDERLSCCQTTEDPVMAIMASNKKHREDASALLSSAKKPKCAGKQKPISCTRKTSSSITAYFGRS